MSKNAQIIQTHTHTQVCGYMGFIGIYAIGPPNKQNMATSGDISQMPRIEGAVENSGGAGLFHI